MIWLIKSVRLEFPIVWVEENRFGITCKYITFRLKSILSFKMYKKDLTSTEMISSYNQESRKNRFLEHLLARFGEDTTIINTIFTGTNEENLTKQVNIKANLLSKLCIAFINFPTAFLAQTITETGMITSEF